MGTDLLISSIDIRSAADIVFVCNIKSSFFENRTSHRKPSAMFTDSFNEVINGKEKSVRVRIRFLFAHLKLWRMRGMKSL